MNYCCHRCGREMVRFVAHGGTVDIAGDGTVCVCEYCDKERYGFWLSRKAEYESQPEPPSFWRRLFAGGRTP